MTQGSRTNQVINLDTELLLGKRLARPAKVFLFGQEWTIRRDLSGAEVVEFWQKITANDGPAAMTLLIGDEGEVFSEKLLALPLKVYQRIFSRLLEIAGIRRGDEPEEETGESMASSSES